MSGGDWKEMYVGVLRGDAALVKHHIENGVDPNYQHPEILCTPLVASIIEGHDELALYLLDHGADPALQSHFDQLTPIEAARQYQRADVLARLTALQAERKVTSRMQLARWVDRLASRISGV
jgi:uncharacterized protein